MQVLGELGAAGGEVCAAYLGGDGDLGGAVERERGSNAAAIFDTVEGDRLIARPISFRLLPAACSRRTFLRSLSSMGRAMGAHPLQLSTRVGQLNISVGRVQLLLSPLGDWAPALSSAERGCHARQLGDHGAVRGRSGLLGSAAVNNMRQRNAWSNYASRRPVGSRRCKCPSARPAASHGWCSEP